MPVQSEPQAQAPVRFDPTALAWVLDRVEHVPVPVHRVADPASVEQGHPPVMVCGWQPPAKGHLLLALTARDRLHGLFCIRCWTRQP